MASLVHALHAPAGSSGIGLRAQAGGERTALSLRSRPDGKMEALRQLLHAETGQTLVFARTKHGAERIAKTLVRDGFSAAMIHGDRSQSQRNGALAGFQDGHYRVLVATDIASRGSTSTT